jgi:hypothetical protein
VARAEEQEVNKDIGIRLLGGLLGLLAILMCVIFVVLLVMLPTTLKAQAECLKAGYPKASVTWNLDAYCMNLDGAVTTKVVRQP